MIPWRDPEEELGEYVLTGIERLEQYLASGMWEGKAGAFGFQDGPPWLHLIAGSASNVVGLPMELLARMWGELPEK